MKKNKRYLALFCIVFLMLLILPLSLNAKSKMQQNVYVSSDEEIGHNYMVAGQSVELAGHFLKDVYVWGNVVNISGVVEGDVIVGGSYVRISGEVKGNVRAFASNLELNGKVGKNATVAGGMVNVNENTEINWDLLVAGGVVSVNGPVNGMIQAAAGNLEVNSHVGQGINATIDKGGQFILKNNADIKGDINYTWHQELAKDDGSVVEGEVVRHEPSYAKGGKDAKSILQKGYWGMKLFSFAALLLIGLILLAFAGRFSEKVAQKIIEKFGMSIGIGFLVFLVTPIAFIFLLITLIGAPLGVILLALFIILLYVSKVFASLMVGTWILTKVFKKKKVDRYLGFLIGLLVLSIIGLIPLLGGLVWVVLCITALGAFLLVKKEVLKSIK